MTGASVVKRRKRQEEVELRETRKSFSLHRFAADNSGGSSSSAGERLQVREEAELIALHPLSSLAESMMITNVSCPFASRSSEGRL